MNSNHEHMEWFFGTLKSLPECFSLEQAGNVINTPGARPRISTQTGKNPLNYMVMITSTLIIAGVLTWFFGIKADFESDIMEPDKIMENQFNKRTIDSNLPTSNPEKNAEKLEIKEIHKGTSGIKIQQQPEKEPGIKNGSGNADSHVVIRTQGKINQQKPVEQTWPGDTTLNGVDFIVKLSDHELKKLGFLIDSTGLYYKNRHNERRVYFHSRYVDYVYKNRKTRGGEITRISDKKNQHNKKPQYSTLDFYPVRITDKTLVPSDNDFEKFKLQNDTLLPVVLTKEQLKYGSEDKLIWFKTAPALFNVLPPDYSSLQNDLNRIKELKNKGVSRNVVIYAESNQLTNSMRLIQLKKHEYSKIGFTVNNEGISIFTSTDACNWEITLLNNSYTVRKVSELTDNDNAIKLVFLSNIYGKQSLKWRCMEDDPDKWDNSFFNDTIQGLVPVIMRKSHFPEKLREDMIFWFVPSRALFDSLPDPIGMQLKNEYQQVFSEKKNLKVRTDESCTYFEACKSTLVLDDFKMYPNPASNILTVEFEADEAMKGKILLVNISGRIDKTLMYNPSIHAGFNRMEMDISGTTPGIYLLYIKTGKGFKTQRLVVK